MNYQLKERSLGLDSITDMIFLHSLHCFSNSFEKDGKRLLQEEYLKFESSLSAFLGYFAETKVEKGDKIVQTLLDFTLRHNVNLFIPKIPCDLENSGEDSKFEEGSSTS